ncbi:hypothetical protein EYE42_14995 [Paracoccus subflavus]|uniref:ParB-like N-terminal domain-containing protein n=1 Tax=Paracoccus subflavus TaxID=2528244 RepID=A0A4Q9FX26_9RHOB|nr:ParB/Srx family N-terminal domain-containing protein [Paracoccus subflavus]TBN37012.1 hypothetical protein EYE42_14995 [Paracoccus subflavus]
MKRETIAPASIQYFPLAQLYVSDLNPRQDADPEGIDLLADSLAMIGLIQNLSGILDPEGRVGIVAGGRRLRAIARAVERDATVTERHPELASIPVRIASDEATARAWASAENAAREDLLGFVLQLSRWVRAAVMVVSDTRGHIEEGKRTFGAIATAAR